jgi:hypothetical protein
MACLWIPVAWFGNAKLNFRNQFKRVFENVSRGEKAHAFSEEAALETIGCVCQAIFKLIISNLCFRFQIERA